MIAVVGSSPMLHLPDVAKLLRGNRTMKTTKPWTPAGDPEGINRWWTPTKLDDDQPVHIVHLLEAGETPWTFNPNAGEVMGPWDSEYEALTELLAVGLLAEMPAQTWRRPCKVWDEAASEYVDADGGALWIAPAP